MTPKFDDQTMNGSYIQHKVHSDFPLSIVFQLIMNGDEVGKIHQNSRKENESCIVTAHFGKTNRSDKYNFSSAVVTKLFLF